MRKASLILASLIFASPHLGAAPKHDTYIFVGMSQPSIDLLVSDEGTEGKPDAGHSISYEPELPNIAILGFSYAGYTLSMSQDLGSSDSNALDYTDYSLAAYFPWIGVDATYSEFIRFRINENSGFDQSLKVDEYDKRDLAMTLYTANLYVFPLRYNFDFGAAFDPSKDKTNGIGLGLVGSWNRTGLDSRFGLIPEPWKLAFGSDGAFVRGELTGTSVQAALSGTIKLSMVYLSALFGFGPGEHQFTYETDTSKRSGRGSQTIIRQKLMAGLTGDRLFLAATLSNESPDYALKYMTLESSRLEVGAVAGVKF